VAVRVASFELVLLILEQAQRRQDLSLSALQQRFRVPPRCPSLPDPVIPQHLLATYDHLVPLAALSGRGSGTAAAPETTQAGALPQPLAAASRASKGLIPIPRPVRLIGETHKKAFWLVSSESQTLF